MSARLKRYPTRWSAWEWSNEHRCYTRYREVAKDRLEWDYQRPPTTSKILLPSSYEPRISSSSETRDEYGSAAEIQPPSPYTPSHALAEPLEINEYEEDPISLDTHDDYGLRSRKGKEVPHKDEELGSGRYELVDDIEALSLYSESHIDKESRTEGFRCTWESCSKTFPRSSELERHITTEHVKDGARPFHCPFEDCRANVRSWATKRGLHAHERAFHGSAMEQDPPGSRSQAELETDQEDHHEHSHADELYSSASSYGKFGKGDPGPTPRSSVTPNPTFILEPRYLPLESSRYVPRPTSQSTLNNQRNIYSENPKTKYSELDHRFKVHKSHEFEFGRVFKVLWSEPSGSGGTTITGELQVKYGEKISAKIRRFLIVKDSSKGHCTCIPISTYGKQGVLKRGVHPEDHAVIYSGEKPQCLEGEIGLISKKPIKVNVKSQENKLDPLSRLNYAKLYTVEHNVKVFFIGRVDYDSEQEVVKDFNETHPPIARSSRGYGSRGGFSSGMSAEETRYALGGNESYAAAYSSGGPGYSSSAARYSDRAGQYSSSIPSPASMPLNYVPNPTFSHSAQGPSYDDAYDED